MPRRNLLAEATRWARITMRLEGKQERRVTTKRVRLLFNNKRKSLRSKLIYLYGETRGEETFEKIERKIAAFERKKPRKLKLKDRRFDPLQRFTEKDALFITYPDSLQRKGERPLRTLHRFARRHLKESVSAIHILPFYPSSGDRGFAPLNYKKVDPKFGSWDDIRAISADFDLMFEGIFNHISSRSRWFKQFLRGNPLYEQHFIAYEQKSALSPEALAKVTRPRTSELLSPFKSKEGTRYVWTTFGREQVDLNYREARLLLRIIDVLFRYGRNGATMIRLDAINYLWKEPGSSCSHLKQTHVIIQLLRDVLDIAAPSISLVTETNVPHSKNISYLGKNEAQMIYNFSLPPLILHAIYRGETKYLTRWAARLERTPAGCTYFNFLASHDGIGVVPLQRLMPRNERRFLIRKARERGSLVSYRSKNGGRIPYELNCTWWNAVNDMTKTEEEELRIRRYLATWAIAFSLKGVPGVYIHALLGSENDEAAAKRSGVARDINRRNLKAGEVDRRLRRATRERELLQGIASLLKRRRHHAAFHPGAEQEVLQLHENIFTIVRTALDGKERVLCLVNVTGKEQQCRLHLDELRMKSPLYDLLKRRRILATKDVHAIHSFTLRLAPYEARWLKSA